MPLSGGVSQQFSEPESLDESVQGHRRDGVAVCDLLGVVEPFVAHTALVGVDEVLVALHLRLTLVQLAPDVGQLGLALGDL